MFLTKAIPAPGKTKNLLAGNQFPYFDCDLRLQFYLNVTASLQLSRGRNYQSKLASDPANLANEEPGQPSKAVPDAGNQVDRSQSSKSVESVSQAADHSFQDRVVNGAGQHVAKKVFLFLRKF